MRRLIVTNIVSLDGYYEGPGGDVRALPMDGAFDEYNAERLGTADTLLLGRSSFGLLLGFWPPVADDPAATPAEQETSRRNNTIEKVVISNTLTADGAGVWSDTTRIVPRAEAHAAVTELKGREGGDILVFGSRVMWHDLLAAGLVNELHLVIGSVALGGGTPAFPEGEAVRLERLDMRTFEGSDNTVIQYAVAHT